jgi:hypothetical protein
MQQFMQRKTINLIGATGSAVESFLTTGTGERAVLEELVGEELGSESDVLRALVALGMDVVRERQLEQGYASLAAHRDDEDEAWTRASTRWAAERWRDDR